MKEEMRDRDMNRQEGCVREERSHEQMCKTYRCICMNVNINVFECMNVFM